MDGYTFRDLNRNGEFDIYEDSRGSIDERAEDLLSLMALDEELNMLKGTGIGTILERKELNLDTGRRLYIINASASARNIKLSKEIDL